MSEIGQITGEKEEHPQRVLFLPHNPHDVETAAEVFDDYDIQIYPFDSLSALVKEARRDSDCLLLAEEAFHCPDFDELIEFLEQQPEWSDLPVIVATRRGSSSRRAWHLAEIANVTLIKRPFPIKTLITVVQSALRDRHRQYEIRQSIANRDNFLAMVSHEIRNPLATISLATQLLDSNTNGIVDVINRQVRDLQRITDDLREISKISQGIVSFDMVRLDLLEVIRETVSAFAPIADDQGLKLGAELPDEPLWVDGDSLRLGQVLGNLLSNSIRYTPEGGRIDVEAQHRGELVMVSVRDTGIGIAPEKLDGIFDLFARAHRGNGAGDQGMGLGLNLACNITQAHNGELVAESAGEGKRSRFSLYLPAADPREVARRLNP